MSKSCTLNKTSSVWTFEVLDVYVLLLPDVLRLVSIYRQPYDPPSCRLTISNLISEFLLYLKSIIYANGRLIIVGYFNIHVDDLDFNDVKKFLDLLYSLRLIQHVTYPAHYKGHILDLIIARTEDSSVTGIDYDWLLPSDHCSIHFTTTFTKPHHETVVGGSGKIRHANINVLASMIKSVLPVMDQLGSDVSQLEEECNTRMKAVII